MRLLNTGTFKVKEFLNDVPIYAILSHTWGEDEVTYQDIQDLEKAKNKEGWFKVEKACNYARRYKFDWIWIDTCCIDKSSSAELSEALNSMYGYYGDSHICIAYLSDVSKERIGTYLEELKQSRWFKRGWTLQELIAPCYMVFLDENWDMIGTRFSMRDIVSEVTSVPVEVFETGRLDGYSIAQKMSWAASRETKREEDMAYCLMGLFGVNMPPIYGEGGKKAFMRLQQEIIKYSDDRSIFAWVASHDYHRNRGLFASSPSEFASSGDVGMSESDVLSDKSSFSFGNNGLRIHLPLHRLPDKEDIFVVSLHCRDADGFIGVCLQKRGHRYIRYCPHFSLPHIKETSKDLQEVVVEESAIPRQRIKHDNYEIPIEFKLDSQLTLIGRMFRGTQADTHKFRLRTKKGMGFHVELMTLPNAIIPAVTVRLGHRASNGGGILLQDSHQLPIDKGNALVSCFVHMTGDSSNQRIAEFTYIPSSSADFRICQYKTDKIQCSPRALSPLVAFNFVVEADSTSDYFHEVSTIYASESNFLWKQDGKNAYGSLSNPCEQLSIHSVFMYAWRRLWCKKKFVFIALGLRRVWERSIPWVDIFVSDDELPISGVWQSYHLSESRYRCKHDVTATTTLDHNTSLTVTVKSSELLFHHIVIKEEHKESQIFNRQGKDRRLMHNVKGGSRTRRLDDE